MRIKLFENFEKDNIIDEILKGYLEAALWTNELDDDFSIDNFDEDSIELSKKEIDDFFDNLEDEDILYLLQSEMSYDQIGHDFWLTRNGHGSGFWDRDIGDLGKIASKVAEKFPNRNIFPHKGGKLIIE